jgi:hypothetical protein
VEILERKMLVFAASMEGGFSNHLENHFVKRPSGAQFQGSKADLKVRNGNYLTFPKYVESNMEEHHGARPYI